MIIMVGTFGVLGYVFIQIWIVSCLKEINKTNRHLVDLAVVANKINLEATQIALSTK